MPDLDLTTVEAQPPPLDERGEPIACPRCGRIYERPLEGIPGHPVGHPRLCPPMAGEVPRDARERKRSRRGMR